MHVTVAVVLVISKCTILLLLMIVFFVDWWVSLLLLMFSLMSVSQFVAANVQSNVGMLTFTSIPTLSVFSFVLFSIVYCNETASLL